MWAGQWVMAALRIMQDSRDTSQIGAAEKVTCCETRGGHIVRSAQVAVRVSGECSTRWQ